MSCDSVASQHETLSPIYTTTCELQKHVIHLNDNFSFYNSSISQNTYLPCKHDIPGTISFFENQFDQNFLLLMVEVKLFNACPDMTRNCSFIYPVCIYNVMCNLITNCDLLSEQISQFGLSVNVQINNIGTKRVKNKIGECGFKKADVMIQPHHLSPPPPLPPERGFFSLS